MIDRSTVIGLLATAGLLVWVMYAGAGFAVDVFWRAPSLALVVGGALLTTLMSFSGARFRSLWGVLRNATRIRTRPAEESIVVLVALAELARREGLLALERRVKAIDDDFLQRAMHLAIDGVQARTIESVVQAELEGIEQRHTAGRGMLESMGKAAPVFGMMGTLIGLVVMLGRMEDPASIGPGMAVALLTTLYGLMVANVFCMPLARKLAQRSSEELLAKTIILKGVLAIQAGDHPWIVERKLSAYLPADRRGGELLRGLRDRAGPLGSEASAAPAAGPPARGGAGCRDLVDAA